MREETVFISDDGQQFSTRESCMEWENTTMVKSQLSDFVGKNIGYTYIDDFGAEIIDLDNVVDFLLSHSEEVRNILARYSPS